MQFLFAVIALAAVVMLFLGLQRIYRSSTRPRWMDQEFAVMGICVALTGAIAGSIGAVIAASLQLPLPLWGDAAVALAVVAGSVVVVRLLFRAVAGRGGAAVG